MRRLPLPTVVAVAVIGAGGGASCTKGTGPELDAAIRLPGDAHGSGADGGSGVPHDAAPDGPGSDTHDAAPPDAMRDASLQ